MTVLVGLKCELLKHETKATAVADGVVSSRNSHYVLKRQVRRHKLFAEMAVASSWAKEASQQRLRAAMLKVGVGRLTHVDLEHRAPRQSPHRQLFPRPTA